MPVPDPAALDFLLTRRSRPAKTLTGPVPSREELMVLLTAATRVPDHGKLEPWRFIVLGRPALDRLAGLAATRAGMLGLDEATAGKGVSQFAQSPLCVAVISAPVISDKVPEVEQLLSAGAACMALLSAALAAGWGAAWLTGWPSEDRDFLEAGLRLAPRERVAGFLHIGTESGAPPDRPRPDLDRIVSWAE